MADRDEIALPRIKRIGIREFRGNFSGFMRQVRHGSSFIVTSRDQIVAIVQPPRPATPPLRQPGMLRGKLRIGPDFDRLPADILSTLEGDGE